MIELDTQKLMEMRRHLRGILSLVEAVLEQRGELRCPACHFKHKEGQCHVASRTFLNSS